jgi:hypothetical protein
MSKHHTKEEILEKLKYFQDPTFTFEPIEHVYHLKGKKLTSSTGYIDRFHKGFDKEYWSQRKADEAGVDVSVILEKWDSKRDRACHIGTLTHNYIEEFYMSDSPNLPEEQDAINKIEKFHKIYETKLKQLEPIGSEIRVYSRKWPVCGTLDQLYLYNGQVMVGDWKTNEEMTTDKNFCFNYLLGPFSKYKDNKLNKYSLQISLYQLLLEEAGIYSDYGFICHLPHGEDEDAKIYKLHNFKEQLRAHLDSELHTTNDDEIVVKSNKSRLF